MSKSNPMAKLLATNKLYKSQVVKSKKQYNRKDKSWKQS